MRRTHAALGLLMFLAACQPAGLVPAKKATPKPNDPVVAATAATVATASPTAQPAASPAWAGAVKLEAPAGQTSVLSGRITMDPSYIVAAGAGNIVASGAGNIVAAGAGNIVASGAGNLQIGGRIVAAGAGNVVAAGGGSPIISGNGSAIVAAGAGNIVASGAGNIVAAGAGNIVASGAGNIVASGAGNVISGNGSAAVTRLAARKVLAAAASRDPIPGAGMLISVLSLRSHRYLSLGSYKDGDGKPQPVYSIYSNADGAYTLYLPAEEAGNVMVVASPPGQTNDDRLIYNVVADPKRHDVPIDEDTALAGRYLHFAFSGRIAEVLATDDAGVKAVVVLIGRASSLPKGFQDSLADFLSAVNHAGAKYKVASWKNQKDVDDLAVHLTDRALSFLDDKLMLVHNTGYDGPEEEAIAGMATSLRLIRMKVTEKLADPGFFTVPANAFTLDDAACHRIKVNIELKKPSDLGDYLVSHFLTTNVENGISNVGLVCDQLGVSPIEGSPAHKGQQQRIETAAYSVLQATIPFMLSDNTMVQELEAYCTRPDFHPELDPTRQPLVKVNCPSASATPR
ncbi:MAG: hypothetical protein JWM80_4288 [Cyanobacteria bacterium RYN_339]|nr:hypothetical protein [Cyanobacteria bacterium RYN_339]